MIPLRFRALGNVLRGKLGLHADLRLAAADCQVLQPEETEPLAPVLCLSGHFNRATRGVEGHSTLQEEMTLATRDTAIHAPVLRYLLRDCLVHSQGVEYLGGSIHKAGNPWKRIPLGRIRSIPRAAYCMAATSHRYFGHWLSDACPTGLLAHPDEAVILDLRSDWPHAREYAAAFSLAPLLPEVLHVGELAVFQDHGQGSSKRRRYQVLRQRLAAAFGRLDGVAGRPVYLRRGDTGIARVISNEDQVISTLAGQGFEVVDIRGATAKSVYAAIAAAPLVVSMDGSHLNHLYFAMQPGTGVLSFMPTDRFTANNRGYACAVGMRFGMLLVDRSEGGYAVGIDDLKRTLDLFGR